MKKVILSLAGVLAATAFAPEAAALPSFARQTGMACTACHFQHFPVLSPFGRAFKASGYTMMGAQGKIEGEHLSIPDTLNASVLLKALYVKTNGTDPAGTISGTTTNSGQWAIPDEMSLFFGGRVAENIGMFMEDNIATGNGAGGIISGFKMPVIFDMGGAKVGVTPYLTADLGAFYGYDQSSSGQIRGIRWAEKRKNISAQQYVGMGAGPATGLAISASNDMGYVSVSRYSPNFVAAAGASAVQLSSTALRLAVTPTVGDWNLVAGIGMLSGTNYDSNLAVPVAANKVETKASNFDVQAQGNLGGNDTSIYVTYATTSADTGTTASYFNGGGVTAKSAMTAGIEYSVINHVAHVGFAIRQGKNGGASGSNGDNSMMVTGIYELAQNVEVHLNVAKYSGSAWTGLPAGTANQEIVFLLEAAW